MLYEGICSETKQGPSKHPASVALQMAGARQV
jgi:hypothetical protein